MGEAPVVIVIGGSIGGLSCAHALLQAGCCVKIFERASKVTPAGAGLGLDMEACAVLEGFGLAEQLARVTWDLHTEANFAVDAHFTNEALPAEHAHSTNGRPPAVHPCDTSGALPAVQAQDTISADPAAHAHHTTSADPASSVHDTSGALPAVHAHCTTSADPAVHAHHTTGANPAVYAHDTSGALPAVHAHNISGAFPAVQRTLFKDPSFRHRSAHWSDIHCILLEALPAGILHMGHQVVGFQQKSSEPRVSITVETSSHSSDATKELEIYEADLLVSADGNMSQTRQTLFPDDKRRFCGYCAWRGVLQRDSCPAAYDSLKQAVMELGSCNIFFIGHGTHAVLYELPGRRINWLWYINRPEPPLSGHSLTFQASDADVAAMREAAPRFWPPELAHVMQATPDPFINAIYDRDPISTWSVGRVVLVGEAAHPTSPHGARATNMAILDAAALGQALSASQNDIDAALRTFQEVRIPVTRDQVLFSRRLGRAKQGLVEGFPASGLWLEATEEEVAQMPMSQLQAMGTR